jgi:hypothetical protein
MYKSQTLSPKVFISHASEDKERFVEGFATKLIKKGVDAWFDKWEMQPGDSLVDKIFEDGIKNASVCIVVLSQNSVAKPWVREEMNAAVVKRIQEKIKIIPIVIDDCKVPEALKSILWQRIPNLSSYETELSKIVNAIFGRSEKPEIGDLSSNSTVSDYLCADLTPLDSEILKIICDKYIEDFEPFVSRSFLISASDRMGISEDELLDSIQIMAKYRYIKVINFIGHPASEIAVTVDGFELYANKYLPEYYEVYKQVIVQIVNFDKRDEQQIVEDLRQPCAVVRIILLDLAAQELIRLPKGSNGAAIHILEVSPELKRIINR